MSILHPNLELEDNTIYVKKLIVRREEWKQPAIKKHAQKYDQLIYIGVYCRGEENVGERFSNSKGPELDFTFTWEMGLKKEYFTHWIVFDIDVSDAVLKENAVTVLEEYNSMNTLMAVLVDNISTNTGCEAALIFSLAKNPWRWSHTISRTQSE